MTAPTPEAAARQGTSAGTPIANGRSPAIDLRGVHESFGQVQPVRGIDVSIAPGEIVALLGPNGVGKTTAIDIAAGAVWRFRKDTVRV